VTMSVDGTKMYAYGSTTKTIYQYTLSTAYDISTASYASKSFATTSQGSPTQITFKADGTRVFVMCSNDSAFSYTLSTAWDISTASYDSKTKSVSSQDSGMTGIQISADGLKMLTVGYTNDNIYSYTMSTAWDLSTASYDSQTFDVSGFDDSPVTLTISADGNHIFVGGGTGLDVNELDAAVFYTVTLPAAVDATSYDSHLTDARVLNKRYTYDFHTMDSGSTVYLTVTG